MHGAGHAGPVCVWAVLDVNHVSEWPCRSRFMRASGRQFGPLLVQEHRDQHLRLSFATPREENEIFRNTREETRFV